MTWFSIIQMCNGLAPLQFLSDNIPTERKKERPLPTLWIPCCSRKNNNSSNNNNNKKRWTSTTVCTLPRDRLRPGPEIRSARVLRPPPPPSQHQHPSLHDWKNSELSRTLCYFLCCWRVADPTFEIGGGVPDDPDPTSMKFSDSTERHSKTQLG